MKRVSPARGGCPFCGAYAADDDAAEFSHEFDLYFHITCLEHDLYNVHESKLDATMLDILAREFATLLRERREWQIAAGDIDVILDQ